jgi:deoxyribonuclease V
MDFPEMRIRARAVGESRAGFPYVPGLLSFRETPAILAALEQLFAAPRGEPYRLPDVLIVDGHGLAHPRRFGIACHIGVLLDIPTIGCAKSVLVGEVGELGEEAGCVADLVFGEEIIGAAVRTRKGVKPVYVSVGHKIDLESAISLVLACCQGRRLPEPTRQAHILANSEEPVAR